MGNSWEGYLDVLHIMRETLDLTWQRREGGSSFVGW